MVSPFLVVLSERRPQGRASGELAHLIVRRALSARESALRFAAINKRPEEQISFLAQIQENPFSAASSIEAACEALRHIADQHGFPYFSYLQLNGRGTGDRIVANYPQEWRQRYETKLYIHYDPVVTVARQARLPFFWNNGGFIQPYRKAQQKVFHEAGSYGINTGYSIPIAGRSGECGLFSVAAYQERLLLDALGPSGHLVYLLGLQLHDHLLGLVARPLQDRDETRRGKPPPCGDQGRSSGSHLNPVVFGKPATATDTAKPPHLVGADMAPPRQADRAPGHEARRREPHCPLSPALPWARRVNPPVCSQAQVSKCRRQFQAGQDVLHDLAVNRRPVRSG